MFRKRRIDIAIDDDRPLSAEERAMLAHDPRLAAHHATARDVARRLRAEAGRGLPPPPSDLADEVIAALRAGRAPRPLPAQRPIWLAVAAAAALIVGVATTLRPHPRTPAVDVTAPPLAAHLSAPNVDPAAVVAQLATPAAGLDAELRNLGHDAAAAGAFVRGFLPSGALSIAR